MMQDHRQKNLEYEKKIVELQRRNEELKEEKQRLIEDPIYLERVARERMGLVREGEKGLPHRRSRGATLVVSSRFLKNTAGWSSPVARKAHNLEVAGSNPCPRNALTRPYGLAQHETVRSSLCARQGALAVQDRYRPDRRNC